MFLRMLVQQLIRQAADQQVRREVTKALGAADPRAEQPMAGDAEAGEAEAGEQVPAADERLRKPRQSPGAR